MMIEIQKGKKMAAKSKLERYKQEISDLIGKGVSVHSAWKIVLADGITISYDAFLHFVNKHIKKTK